MSLICRRNSIEDSKQPWGTPTFTGMYSEQKPSTATLMLRPMRPACVQRSYCYFYSGNIEFLESFCLPRHSCFTVIIIYHCICFAKSMTTRDGCGFDPHSRKWIIIYQYIYLFALASILNPGVEFCHSQNASKNATESGERSVLTLGSLYIPSCLRESVWSWLDCK